MIFSTLDPLIRFKYIIALMNEGLIMSSFSMKIKSNVVECLILIGKLNEMYLNFIICFYCNLLLIHIGLQLNT